MSARSAGTSDTDAGASGGSSARVRARREGLGQTVAAAAELLEEGDRAHAGIPNDARDLLLNEIEPDALQPRRHFDEADLRVLAEDIARRGVLQPILVRPAAAPGGHYRLVAGERRWRAAQIAGKVRIPARVRPMSDEDVRSAQMAENVLRADLSDIEKGKALRELYELRKAHDTKTTWEDIAADVGLGRARIHDLFQLASLPEPVTALIAAGRLSGSHGIALQRAQDTLPSEEILALAEQAARPPGRRVGGYGLSVDRLRREIRTRTEAGGAPNTTQEAETGAVRPYVRRTIEALAAGRLSTDERRRLLAALQDQEAASDGRGRPAAKKTQQKGDGK